MRMSARGFVIAWVFAACATGGTADNQKSDGPPVEHRDAQHPLIDALSHADAQQQGDASIPIDAPVQQVDGGGGGLCSDNTMCTTAGTCCFVVACVPGTPVGVNICLPM